MGSTMRISAGSDSTDRIRKMVSDWPSDTSWSNSATARLIQ